MGVEHTFYDYMEGSGRNPVHEWLHSVPKDVRQKFNKWLNYLEATPMGNWRHRQAETLKIGECDGLFEIRVQISRIQYRLLGCHGIGDKTPTLLYGFLKKGGLVPQKDCRKAQEIRATIVAEPIKYRVEHNYE